MPLFRGDTDPERFLAGVDEPVAGELVVHAFYLMPNHYLLDA